MRTTVNIDDDVLAAVKDLARRSGGTSGKLLSDLVRAALAGSGAAAALTEEKAFYGFKPLAANGRIVTDDEIERLRGRDGI